MENTLEKEMENELLQWFIFWGSGFPKMRCLSLRGSRPEKEYGMLGCVPGPAMHVLGLRLE